MILSDVLEHIVKPEKHFAEVHRVLRPNGKLILNVPFYYWLHEEPFDYFRYTQYALKKFLESVQFEVIQFEVNGGGTAALFDTMMKRFSAFGKYGRIINKVIFWMYYHFLNQMEKKAIDIKMPLGYGLVAKKNIL